MQQTSKTHISQRASTKTNLDIVNAIIKLKSKNIDMAKALAMPRKKRKDLNLSEIDSRVKDGEKVFVSGKILSGGSLSKKVKLIYWAISEKAKEKIKDSKVDAVNLMEELKKNADFKGVKII